MDVCCGPAPPVADRAYRRVLAIALALNTVMFGVELFAGLVAGSSALLADAVDFLGDASNYALSLGALALAPVWRTRAAFVKGLSMGAYGLFVLAATALYWQRGITPDAATMGAVGALAFAVNIGVAFMLFRYRNGDADMRSVWLCSRNDAIGNVAVMLAAAGVFGTGSGWPDTLVALLLASLALTASAGVLRQSIGEGLVRY